MQAPVGIPGGVRGGGLGDGLMRGLQGFQQGMQLGETVRAAKARRKMDKLLSSLGNKTPTQDQFKKIARLVGPEAANDLLSFHHGLQDLTDKQRVASMQDFAQNVDMLGTLTETLSGVPEEQRMGVFENWVRNFAMTGAEQGGGPNPASMRMLSLARSVYRDGDFSDQRLQRASGIAAMGGQYQQIMDARAERSSRERIAATKADADVAVAQAKGPRQTNEEINWKLAGDIAQASGGNRWDIFDQLTRGTPDADLDGNRQSLTGDGPRNLGDPDGGGGGSGFIDANFDADGNVIPGSVGDVLSLAQGGAGVAPGQTAPVTATGSSPQAGSGAAAAATPQGSVAGADTSQRQNMYDAIVMAESGGSPDAVSPKGARGLMQIMPRTARKPGFGLPNVFELADQMGIPYAGKTDKAVARLLENPELNRAFGENYFNALMEEFGGDMTSALVAYNWGPGSARKWIEGGSKFSELPTETRKYVTSVFGHFRKSMERG